MYSKYQNFKIESIIHQMIYTNKILGLIDLPHYLSFKCENNHKLFQVVCYIMYIISCKITMFFFVLQRGDLNIDHLDGSSCLNSLHYVRDNEHMNNSHTFLFPKLF